MSKITKLVRVLNAIIKKPSLLNLTIQDDDFFTKKARSLGLEEGFPVVDITDILPNFSETIKYFSSLDGGSLITDLAIIKKITSLYKEAQYFEIGTWRGESIANVAEVAKDCYTLNLTSEQLREIGLNEKYIDQQDLFSKNIPNITHLKGDSLKYNFNDFHNKFDVVFVDGDHHYESVKKDAKTAFKLIKDENSTIIWHDYGFSPEVIRHEVMTAIYEGTPKKYRDNLFHVSNSLCAIFTTKKYPVYKLNSFLPPSKTFNINIEAKKIVNINTSC